ncbi:hypothetical protein C8R45DRAFT_1157839 [Mycena sanguinolenta]|nr:hypothetical protein C8R45DRAFT_1157839 [Mycena sanguinolenta]
MSATKIPPPYLSPLTTMKGSKILRWLHPRKHSGSAQPPVTSSNNNSVLHNKAGKNPGGAVVPAISNSNDNSVQTEPGNNIGDVAAQPAVTSSNNSVHTESGNNGDGLAVPHTTTRPNNIPVHTGPGKNTGATAPPVTTSSNDNSMHTEPGNNTDGHTAPPGAASPNDNAVHTEPGENTDGLAAYTRWFRRKKSSVKAPAVTPGASSANDKPAESGNKAEWAIDSFTLVLDLAKQACAIAGVAPFVGPAAELIQKIIDSYKEFKDVDEKRNLLAQRITDITGDICATVLRMQEANYSDQIGRLMQDLRKYATLIEEASQFINSYDSHGTLIHFAGHNQVQDEMDRLQHQLDMFGVRFGNNRLVDLCIQESTNTHTLGEVYDAVIKKKLEEWLKCPDMAQKQLDTEKLHAEGTGQWFLEDKRFIEWEDNPGVLWVEGPSGAGKSVISSTVINDVFVHQARFAAQAYLFAVAFFYFDFRNKDTQSVEAALRRIVLQLSAQSPHPYKTLDQHWELSKGQKLPKSQELFLLLFKLLRELGHTYIFLDALDECDSSNFQDLVRLVAELKAWAETPLHLCITSQPRDLFTKSFIGVTQIALEANIVNADIKFFVTTELETNPSLEPWQPHATQVIGQITRKATGM